MKNPVDIHIGQRLRRRRWLQGMTQQQLAQAVGIRFQQIQKYESGANRICASRLWDIARALNVAVPFFFRGLQGANGDLGLNDSVDDTLQQKETIDLVRAYRAMSEGTRRRFFALTVVIGSPESPSNEESGQTAFVSTN